MHMPATHWHPMLQIRTKYALMYGMQCNNRRQYGSALRIEEFYLTFIITYEVPEYVLQCKYANYGADSV